MKRYLRILNISFLLIFASLLLLPSLNEQFHFIKGEKVNENRNKAKKPQFDVSKLDAFVKNYDAFYSDNFSLRENGILMHNKLEYTLWGVSPAPDEVVIGKDGWFYDKDNTDNYSGKNAFTENQISELREELACRTKWAEEHGVKYYVAVVPTKMSVYPECLPAKMIKVSHNSQYDQIVSLDNKSGIRIIDVRKNLLKHKAEGYEIFQRTDGHWNDLGAYYGYQAILERISADFEQLMVSPLGDYSISTEKRRGGAIVSMVGLEDQYPEQFVKLTEKKKVFAHDGVKRDYSVPETVPSWEHQIIKVNANAPKLKCLIIRDSFTLLLIRYLQEHFQESIFIHDEWKYRMREDLIEKEKPDIVINVIFETGAGKLLEFPFNQKAKTGEWQLKN